MILNCSRNGSVLIGHAALAQSEKNSMGTIYDAKRFIGRLFSASDPTFQSDIKRYPFQIELDEDGRAWFLVPTGDSSAKRLVR